MAKDYAKKMISAPRRKPRKERRFASVAVAIFAVVCVVSAIGYAIHVYHQAAFFSKEHMTAWFDSAKTVFSRKGHGSTKTAKPAAPASSEEIQFDFYTELPNMQVNLPASAQLKPLAPRKLIDKTDTSIASGNNLAGQIDDSIKVIMAQHVANAVQKPTVQFIVQLGEFKDQVSASELRLSLLLAGVETQIIKVSAHAWRVQQGPFVSQRQAKSAQQKLNRKGFESSVKEI